MKQMPVYKTLKGEMPATKLHPHSNQARRTKQMKLNQVDCTFLQTTPQPDVDNYNKLCGRDGMQVAGDRKDAVGTALDPCQTHGETRHLKEL